MIYIFIVLAVILFAIVVILYRAPSRILFIPTPNSEFGDNGEVSSECTQHYHSYGEWFGKDEKGNWFIYRRMTHFWECTSETCPNDGDGCERPRPHQQWGVGPKIHDKSL